MQGKGDKILLSSSFTFFLMREYGTVSINDARRANDASHECAGMFGKSRSDFMESVLVDTKMEKALGPTENQNLL